MNDKIVRLCQSAVPVRPFLSFTLPPACLPRPGREAMSGTRLWSATDALLGFPPPDQAGHFLEQNMAHSYLLTALLFLGGRWGNLLLLLAD